MHHRRRKGRYGDDDVVSEVITDGWEAPSFVDLAIQFLSLEANETRQMKYNPHRRVPPAKFILDFLDHCYTHDIASAKKEYGLR